MKTFDDSSYRDRPGFVYLIQARGTRRFKIGLTTRSVEQRFAELNSSQSPYPLELLEYIATDNVTEIEGYLHGKFAPQRRHGEWFEFNQRQVREVLREFDKLENGDCNWLRLPSLPYISFPSLPSLPQVDANFKALVVAGIGATWLMFGFSGCFSHQPTQQPTTEHQP